MGDFIDTCMSQRFNPAEAAKNFALRDPFSRQKIIDSLLDPQDMNPAHRKRREPYVAALKGIMNYGG
jgi:hypothetical protein